MKKHVNTLESLYLQSYPAKTEVDVNGWLVRISNGLGPEFNSFVPVNNYPDDDIEKKVLLCESEFLKQGRKPMAKVLSNSPSKLSYILEKRGYNFISKHYVMRIDLPGYYSHPVVIDKIHNNQAITDEWIDAYLGFDKRTEENRESLRTLLYRIKNNVICTYYTVDDVIKATALGVINENVINISFMGVARYRQPKEVQKALINKILLKASEAGLESAYVRTESTDYDLLKIFDRMGFETEYSYIFRQKTN